MLDSSKKIINESPDFALNRTSLPAAFVAGPLVLPRDKYPRNTIQVQRHRLTNTWKSNFNYLHLQEVQISKKLCNITHLSGFNEG